MFPKTENFLLSPTKKVYFFKRLGQYWDFLDFLGKKEKNTLKNLGKVEKIVHFCLGKVEKLQEHAKTEDRKLYQELLRNSPRPSQHHGLY